jgi:hypothetical protein
MKPLDALLDSVTTWAADWARRSSLTPSDTALPEAIHMHRLRMLAGDGRNDLAL